MILILQRQTAARLREELDVACCGARLGRLSHCRSEGAGEGLNKRLGSLLRVEEDRKRNLRW